MFDPEVLQILGLNLLAGKSPNFGENVGNAGLATLQYQRQREEDKYRREEQAFMKQQRELQLKALQRQDKEDEIMRQVLSVDPTAAARQSMPSLAPTNDNAAQLQSKTAALGAPNSREGMALQLTQTAEALQRAGLYKQAMAMRKQAIELQPDAAGIEEVTGPDGNRMLITRFKDGSVRPLQYGPKPEKLNFQDAGGSILGLDPFTGQQRGQAIPKTPSFSDQVSAGNLAARLAELRDQGVPGLPGVPSLGAPGMPSAPPRPGVPTPAPQGLPPVPNSALPPSPFGMSPKQQRDLAGKRGEAKFVAEQNLPKIEAEAQQTLGLVDAMLQHPGFSTTVGNKGITGAFAAMGRPIHGTDAAGFIALYDQLKGKQFLQAFETLKGGGQITEMEGKKATDAIARMSLAQSEAEFTTAAQEFKSVVAAGLARARQAAGAAPQANDWSIKRVP